MPLYIYKNSKVYMFRLISPFERSFAYAYLVKICSCYTVKKEIFSDFYLLNLLYPNYYQVLEIVSV